MIIREKNDDDLLNIQGYLDLVFSSTNEEFIKDRSNLLSSDDNSSGTLYALERNYDWIDNAP